MLYLEVFVIDTQNLRENHPKLIAFMEMQHYSREYILAVRREIKFILAHADQNGWSSYRDIYDYHAAIFTSKCGLKHKLNQLGIIERFDMIGEFPNWRSRQRILPRGQYSLLTDDFKQAIDFHREAEAARGKKPSTIYQEAINAANFFYEMQCFGFDEAKAITQDAVTKIFINKDGSLRRSCSYKDKLTAVFKANVPRDEKIFNHLIAYLPNLRSSRKNIQYLTKNEVAKVRDILSADNSGLSLRDRAIGILALTYGLRRCDIAGLKLDDVDLNSDQIAICQQKTGAPLTLPLMTAAGNAIYDYVTIERLVSDCEFIFLSDHHPYGSLTSSSIGNIAGKIMAAANIRQCDGDRRGFHIFRYHLATELLGNGVSQPIISKVIGHASPKSLGDYLSADLAHLKECALSVEKFPMRKGIFAGE